MDGRRVLVTGANGHLGYMLSSLLSKHGYTVHASVRNPAAKTRIEPLCRLGVKIVQVDILNPTEVDAAISNVDMVCHVAAVHAISARDSTQEIYRSNVDGTLNVVRSCSHHGISKLVLTSSAAAVGTVLPGEKQRDERSWNDTTTDPYLKAKTLAEMLAWSVAHRQGLEMVAILPSAMIGPGFHRHTPTTHMFDSLISAKVPCSIPMHVNLVDVRDVAEAHLLALKTSSASGRYLCANWQGSLTQLFNHLRAVVPSLRAPLCTIPSQLMPLVCVADAMYHRLTSTPRVITRALYEDYGKRLPNFSTCRISTELGWEPRSLQASLSDTFDWMQLTSQQRTEQQPT